MSSNILKLTAEEQYQEEFKILKEYDKKHNLKIPLNWKLSPQSVLLFIIGDSKLGIKPKYIGNQNLIEVAIATLLTDRSLLLIGEPGTAKSYVSELLSAAINGDSKKVIQGTAGTSEEEIRYSWNYAMLIDKGPSEESLIKSPLLRAMEEGAIVRFEEISRCAPEVQDALISILSEKRLFINQLNKDVPAQKGFCVIATANTKDKGVNEMSAALKRRFNVVVLPSAKDIKTEIEIIKNKVIEQGKDLELDYRLSDDKALEKIATIFFELRNGITIDKKKNLKSLSSSLSSAEAISSILNCISLSVCFNKSSEITDSNIADSIVGVIVKEPTKDLPVFEDYVTNVIKTREGYEGIAKACKKHIDNLKIKKEN